MTGSAALRDLGKRLYPYVPPLAQDALLSGYFYYKGRRLFGRAFQEQRARLARTERYDAAALDALQCDALRRIVDAATRAPYYARLFRSLGVDPAALRTPADLAALPVLEKESVRQAPEDFVDARRERGRLLAVYSSGTSGTPMRFYAPPGLESVEEAFLARQWAWAGYRPGDRRIRLRGDLVVPADQCSDTPWRTNYADRELRMSSYHLSRETAPAYVRRIVEFAPRAMIAYPSSAAVLATMVRDLGLECRIPLVFTSSETLSPAQRQVIESVLHARVFDHYGSTEGVVAIQECDAGAYHVLPEYGICELHPLADDDNAEPLCEIVATGLLNDAMPLLRYRTGDFVRPAAGGACGCGRAFPVIREIVGRQDDLLCAESGALVGRLDHVFKGLHGIVESQIVQQRDRSIRVRLVKGRGYDPAIEQALRQNLRSRLGNLDVVIDPVAAIPRGPNGKFRSVLSQL